MKQVVLFVSWLISLSSVAQTLTISGTIKDLQSGEAIEFVTVIARDQQIVATTDVLGRYEIILPSRNERFIQFRRTGDEPFDYTLPDNITTAAYQINVSLTQINSGMEVVVTAEQLESAGAVR